MRLIIKPGGLALIVVSLIALVAVALRASHSGGTAAVAATGTRAGDNTTITPVHGATASSPGAGGHSVEKELLRKTAAADAAWETLSPGNGVDSREFPANLPDFKTLRRFDIQSLPDKPWTLQLRQPIADAIPMGTHLRLHVRARSKDSCPVTVVCEHREAPFEKMLSRQVTLTPDWNDYQIEWTADRNAPANWSQVSLQLGGKVGQIEIAGVSLVASQSVAR